MRIRSERPGPQEREQSDHSPQLTVPVLGVGGAVVDLGTSTFLEVVVVGVVEVVGGCGDVVDAMPALVCTSNLSASVHGIDKHVCEILEQASNSASSRRFAGRSALPRAHCRLETVTDNSPGLMQVREHSRKPDHAVHVGHM